jgi:hypothetical protein
LPKYQAQTKRWLSSSSYPIWFWNATSKIA